MSSALVNRFDPTSPTSPAGKARAKRWAELLRRFPDFEQMTVLDLGGTPNSWRLAPAHPAHVVTVNLDGARSDDPRIEATAGDACDLPETLRRRRFDLVLSNSLLEHVGGHDRRQRVADTVHAMADRHWVQTPYRYFPVEPHWLFPGIQFLPHRARIVVSRHWTRGHVQTHTWEAAKDVVDEIELVGVTQMRGYFPTSDIYRERFAGLTKSITAVRS